MHPRSEVAFANAAKTVKPGGKLYVMVYAPTYHNSEFVVSNRQFYHQHLNTPEQKLDYAYKISDSPENAINLLDMLNTFYNWTVEEETIHRGLPISALPETITLNRDEPEQLRLPRTGAQAMIRKMAFKLLRAARVPERAVYDLLRAWHSAKNEMLLPSNFSVIYTRAIPTIGLCAMVIPSVSSKASQPTLAIYGASIRAAITIGSAAAARLRRRSPPIWL